MSVKKGLVAVLAVFLAVLFLYPIPSQATFKSDFLYKFQSRWSDVAVNNAGTRIFIINESFSRIEEYNTAGVLQAIHGNFGTGNTEFNRPQGLVIDTVTDTLYVLDTGNNRVALYNVSGASPSFVAIGTPWGSSGTGVGQFSNPSGIATDGTNVYITDTDNNRVQSCPAAGPAASCVVWPIGITTLGIANGQFSGPKGITYDSSTTNIYVADTGNNRVQVFNNAGVYQSKFGTYGSGTSQFVLPNRITIGNGGTFAYVLDTLNRVQRLNKVTGVTDYTFSLDSSGGGIVAIGGDLYITSFPTIIKKYDTTSLAFQAGWTNDIGRPVDMSLDTTGSFYINNNFNLNSVTPTPPIEPVIQKFNSSFIQTAEWKGNSAFGSTVSGPMGIGINTGNNVMVADTDNNQIQKFTSSGTWVYSLVSGPTPGAFNQPKDVATEATGKFYVADTGNGRIMKYEPDGTFIWSQVLPTVEALTPTPPLGPTASPYGITVALDNKIYVADAGYHRILKYNANLMPTPGPETSWGMYGSDDSNPTVPQFDTPQGMAFGPEPTGYIYVADTGNNRIQRFDQTGADRSKWGVYGTQDGNFDEPRNVAVDSASRVYVSEVGNKRIQVFGNAATSAGLTVTQTNGTTISEGITDLATGIDNYTVKLNTQPDATSSAVVYVNITVSDSTQAYVTTPVLAFTSYNWNIPQTVTVVPTHDFIANGTRSVIISHKPSSTDVNYNNPLNISWSDVTVTINDTVDTTGITFSSNNVPWATEGARLSNAYSIVLNTKPTADVTITLSPPSSILLDTNTFTFTPTGSDYSTPRWVHITPVHDYIAQATHSATIGHNATSTDLSYASPNVAFSESSGNVLVTIQDIDTVGVVLSKSSVSVTEGGATDTYTVKLASKPTSTVEIYPTDASPSPTEFVTLSPSTLSFSDTTWNVAQTVTVTAIHDFMQNAISARTTDIIHPDTFSLDPLYNNIPIATIAATINDSDTSGLLISKQGGGSVTVAEGGATDSYMFQLTSLPASNVTITITSTDNQATTSAYFYTFTPANWNAPQYATVSAVDDALEEGTHYGVLLHTLASSDTNFDGKTAYQTATITDNDASGITITLPNGVINIAEAGPSDSYSVKLNSQPNANVTLLFAAQNQATASPTHLIFTPSDWNVNQEVVLTAIQDYIIEGAHTAPVSYTGVSADPNYSGTTASFTANIADDDSFYPGISVLETDGGTSVTKDITTDTYTLSLTSKPSANVKIKIVANGPEATASAGVYYFLPSGWNVPQTVYVSAKTSPSGGKTVKFTHLITSLDAHYDGITAPSVTVTVNENRGSSPSGQNAKAPVCSMTPPYNAPNLFQVTTNQTQATLYFTPIRDNISYYFIAFGFSPGDFRFGTSFEMGSYDGVINYTVNMLTPGTTYYFTVRGGNGCATGPWSAALPATAVGPESPTTTTRNYYPTAASSTGGTSGGGSSGSTSGGGSSPTGGIWLTRDLYPGSQGADVRSLQEHLNANGFTLASSGPGSPGNETTYYGNLTAASVRRFQEAHFAEILSPLGYASGTGICGWSTRNYINSHP